MDHDQKPAPIWQNLTEPVPVSPERHRQIRSQVLASVDRQPGVVVETTVRFDLAAPIPWRSRLLDLVAVAVIVFAMIGVLSRNSQPTTPAVVQTIAAPESQDPEPVMLGGSPAQDYQYPGQILGNLPYEIAAQIDPGTYQSLDQILIYEDTLFVLHEAGSDVELIAYALSDAHELWRTSIADPLMAVTNTGVLTSRTVPGYLEFKIVLLDHETGSQIWASEQVFPASSIRTGSRLVVEGDLVFYADSMNGISSLNLSSGETEWSVRQVEEPVSGLSSEVCAPLGNCHGRAGYYPVIAANDETVFVASTVLGKIVALDRSNGEQRWSVEMDSVAPGHDISYQITAVPGGIITQLYRYPTDSLPGSTALARISETDGATGWSVLENLYSWVTNGETILATGAEPDPLGVNTDNPACCYVLKIDVVTGDVEEIVSPDIFILGLIDNGQTAVTIEMDRLLDGEFRGYNLDDWSLVWDIDIPERGCWPQLPSSADGEIACSGLNGGIKILKPVP